MKKAFVGIIIPVVLFFTTLPALAESKNHIRFVLRSQTNQKILANCGNFSYPGTLRRIGNENPYLIEPSGLIGNPRNLTYTCAFALPGGFSGARDFIMLYPPQFNHGLANSEVVLTVHHVDRKTTCVSSKSQGKQVFILYSLSVDGKLVEDRSHLCFD